MSRLARLKPILMPATSKHTASLIFLHGSGDTGEGIKSWLKLVLKEDFSFPHVRIIYPTAPFRPYTPFGGQLASVWFDRRQISPFCDEDVESLDDMCIAITELVDNEVSKGIPRKRIIIGGFSMGGALAFHLGYRFCNDVAGVFALSSFLNENSIVYKAIRETQQELPPLFQTHGGNDPLVEPDWGEVTHKTLADLGVPTEFKLYPNLFHEMNRKEIEELKNWISKILPDSGSVEN